MGQKDLRNMWRALCTGSTEWKDQWISFITHTSFDEDSFGVHANVEHDFKDDEDDPSQPLNPHEPRELFDFY